MARVRRWCRGAARGERPMSNWWYIAPLLVGLLGCPKPTPTPSPTPEPTPVPTPTPTPTPLCIPPSESEEWMGVEPLPQPENRDALLKTMEELGSPCGQPPEETLDRLAHAMVIRGYCAGRMTDSVFVERDELLATWEEYHPVYYGNGCWTAAPLKGLWRRFR